VPNGKRNTRILFISLIVYIFLHAILFELRETNLICKMLHGYFIWIILSDILLMAVIYKLYYGRYILNELNPIEKDHHDEFTHTYHNFSAYTIPNFPFINNNHPLCDLYTDFIVPNVNLNTNGNLVSVEITDYMSPENNSPKIELVEDTDVINIVTDDNNPKIELIEDTDVINIVTDDNIEDSGDDKNNNSK